MVHKNEVRQNDEFFREGIECLNIEQGIKKSDFGPLLLLLRSSKPISNDVRKLLANLFDPKKPIGIYAKIVLVRGNKSKTLRNDDLYFAVEEWKQQNKQIRVPRETWAKIAKDFKIGGIAAAKAAYAKGRIVRDRISEIDSEE